ncbi:MAG: DoxX family protein [Phycisphaerales bacterium]
MIKINDSVQRGMADAGLLGMRLMLGTVFAFHGSQKLFGAFDGPGIDGFAGFLASIGMPLPTLNAYMAGGAEFFGGLLLASGVFARLASIPVTFTMLVAAFMVHSSGFDARTGGMEYPLTLAVIVAGIGLVGPGRLTLTNAFFALRKPQLTPVTA